MKTNTSLHAAVRSLQQIFTGHEQEIAKNGANAVRKQAERVAFPDPELAAEVYSFLQRKTGTKSVRFSEEDLSEAFVALLMDGEAAEQLGVEQAANPWIHARGAMRNAGKKLGHALEDIDQVVRQTGMGYTPSLSDLAEEIGGVLRGEAASV